MGSWGTGRSLIPTTLSGPMTDCCMLHETFPSATQVMYCHDMSSRQFRVSRGRCSPHRRNPVCTGRRISNTDRRRTHKRSDLCKLPTSLIRSKSYTLYPIQHTDGGDDRRCLLVDSSHERVVLTYRRVGDVVKTPCWVVLPVEWLQRWGQLRPA